MHKRKQMVFRDVFGGWTYGNNVSTVRVAQSPSGSPAKHWMEWHAWVDAHVQRDINGEIINMRTLTIELRFDADEEERHEVLRDAAKQAAKHLYTAALLISTKRKPAIAMYSADMFAGQEEISLADDLDTAE